jgi:hypothetical protein
MRIDGVEKLVVGLFVAALLLGFRGQLFFDPIARRVAAEQQRRDFSIAYAREKIAREDTARFIDENMPTLQSSPDRFALLRTSVATARKDGLYCEFGVFQGESINYIASLVPDRKVHGFDSFEGNPESWRDGFDKGVFAMNGLPPVRSNVVLHKGWFDKTVVPFHDSTTEPIAFAHIDADLYSSAKTVLEAMADRLVAGSVIQFDELFGYPSWKNNGEYKAFTEFVQSRPIRWKYIGYSEQQVAIRIE